ncbi:hypothetical protein [Botrimarina sp.]|uniref:hypothetical protein n=1 Tax=Botrimarina sp. TaxID=2795802 RepID=UPI0032EC8F88
MNANKSLPALVTACLLIGASSAPAAIEVSWDVSSTSVVNASKPGNPPTPAPHGLWTNNFINGSGYQNYFDIQAGTKLVQNLTAGTATLIGTAVNLDGLSATIDLVLSGFADTISPSDYKAGGGPYDGATQDFYSTVTGTITIGNPFGPVDILSVAGTTYFQLGPGANDKDLQFGASTWVIPEDPADSTKKLNHWDLNLALTRTRIPPSSFEPVPEPAGLLVWSLLTTAGAAFARPRAKR